MAIGNRNSEIGNPWLGCRFPVSIVNGQLSIANCTRLSSVVKQPSARLARTAPVLSARERVCARKAVTMPARKLGKPLRPQRIDNLRKTLDALKRALPLRAQRRNQGLAYKLTIVNWKL